MRMMCSEVIVSTKQRTFMQHLHAQGWHSTFPLLYLFTVKILAPIGIHSPIMAPLAQMIGFESLAFRRHNEKINTPSSRVR